MGRNWEALKEGKACSKYVVRKSNLKINQISKMIIKKLAF